MARWLFWGCAGACGDRVLCGGRSRYWVRSSPSEALTSVFSSVTCWLASIARKGPRRFASCCRSFSLFLEFFCVCSRRCGSRNGCGIYAPIRRTSFSPVSSLLCNRKHSAQSWSRLELSISRRHAPFLSRPWLIARSKLSFPVYLVHWPILFGPAARFISAVERHGGNRGGLRLRHRRRNLRRVHLQHGLSQRRWRRARASESIA